MESLSAHVDAHGLIQWMQTTPTAPEMPYTVYGEPDASDALRILIKRELGWKAGVPEHFEAVPLDHPA
jgi:metallo-beta-lactamase family protein